MLENVFNIGMFDKNLKKQVISNDDFIKIIANTVGDCTVKQGAVGVYTHADGSKIVEPSLEVVNYGLTKKQAKTVAKTLCKLLNQESIYLSSRVSKSELIN